MTLATPDTTAREREVHDLLARFSVALGRRRAYAGEHPMVARSEVELFTALRTLLASKNALFIGVARKELLVDGEPLEGRSAAMRDLAERLHRRGVGSLTFGTEVNLAGLRAALEWLSAPPPADGSSNPAGRPDGAGITIRGIAYDHFSLVEAGDADRERVDELWKQLAAIALEVDREDGAHTGEEDASGERRRAPEARASQGVLPVEGDGTRDPPVVGSRDPRAGGQQFRQG